LNPLEIFRYAFEALKERRTRSILTILMVLISAALMTALNGMNAGMENFVLSSFGSLSPNSLIIVPGTSSVTFDTHDVTLLKKIDGVSDAVPFFQGTATLRSGIKTLRVMVVGFDQSKINLLWPTAELEEGSFISPYDSTGMVLGSRVAMPPGKTRPFAWVGQVITAEYDQTSIGPAGQVKKEAVKRSFVVKGVLKYTGAPGFANVDRSALISLQAANSLFKRGSHYDGIVVITVSSDLNREIEKEILKLYSDNVMVISPKAIVQVIERTMAGFSAFTVSIAMVSLMVAAVGIITTLFTSVMERTREIGLLKALGFKNWHVLIMFLSEALIVGMIGGPRPRDGLFWRPPPPHEAHTVWA
jgi:putative ABC transport system permease protein